MADASKIPKTLYDAYLKALLRGQRNTCYSIVTELLSDGVQIVDLYVNLFQASMYEVGVLWETNKITVATEHIATAITESVMSLTYPAIFSSERLNKTAIISCMANEFHQIGAKMAADIFELNGWDTYFLGANTPVNDLYRLIEQKKPDVVGLSLALTHNLPVLIDCLRSINIQYPDVKIILGGQAFRYIDRDKVLKYENTTYIDNIITLDKHLKHAN